MNHAENPFQALAPEALADELASASGALEPAVRPHGPPWALAPTLCRLLGFDLRECPLVGGLQSHPHEVLSARATVPLRRAMVGRDVLVVFVDGDLRRPIIVGVIEAPGLADGPAAGPPAVDVQADGERLVITAEREIVLRCGDASITLTRAGKVLIRGRHILSRSAGYNRIKGAAVDIN